MKAEDSAVKYAYQGMQIISNQLEETVEGKYRHNPYQITVASSMFGRDDCRSFSRISPGDGKTFIMLMLANQHVAMEDKVTLVATDRMLFDQLLADAQIYCQATMVEVTMIKEVTLKNTVDRVVILDEVDLIIDKYAVYFAKDDPKCTVRGLAPCYHSKKLYMLSAIEKQFHTSFLQQVFEMNKSNILRYPSIHQIHNPNQAQNDDNITKIVVRDREEAYRQIVELFRSQGSNNPILLFIEEVENQFDERLAGLCRGAGTPFYVVEDPT